MEEINISQYAKENKTSYKKVWSSIKDGTFPEKTIETKTGRIKILQESKASENKKVEFATPLFADFGEKLEAKASATRRNRSGTITPTDQYKHIEEGLDLFTLGDRSKNNNDTISVSEAIRLVRKCYYNFSDVRNIFDILTEYSTSTIYWKGGTAKSRKFQELLWNKIGIIDLQEKFYMEFNRSCNVFPYRFESIIKDEDIDKLNKTYGAKAAKKVKLPVKYVIIDPCSVVVGGNISFSSPLFYQRLNSYEVQRLIKPITQEDKDFLASLPEEVRKDLNKKTGGNQLIDIPLNPDYVYFIFNKKADYEPLASPSAYTVLRHINAKEELQRMDLATARTTMRAVLHIAMGFENKAGEIFIDTKAMEATRALFESESIGKVLVTDFATKVEWKIPDISKLLGPEKYKELNESIRAGLNNILVGTDEKFANQSIRVKLFIQRLQQSREIFLNKFLIPEVKRIHGLMGFKGKIPTPYYTDFDFKDQDLWNRVVTSMAQMGLITAWEANEAIEEGILPDKETSIENQREYKKLKDEGLYEPVTGGPQTQKELTDKTNKQQLKMQDKQQEFDDKQDTKQKKHEINNPKPEAPQIHINAPGLKKSPGKPKGDKTGPLKKKTKPISASLMRENLILATKLNEKLNKELCKKFKLEKLSEEQDNLTGELLENIMCGEEPKNWLESTSKYLKNPDYINQERFERVRNFIEDIGANNLDDYSAAIAYNSTIENKEEKIKTEEQNNE